MRDIPTIETSRLILRAHKIDDLNDCVRMWSDPVVTRYTIGTPSPEQRTWIRILSYLGHWSLMGFGYWAVEEKATHNYIGELGFADFKREISPSIKGIPELGWALAPSVHGKGYATEGLKAAIQWIDKSLQYERVVCIIHPQNFPSLRVAEKCGFKDYAQTEKNGEKEILFERVR